MYGRIVMGLPADGFGASRRLPMCVASRHVALSVDAEFATDSQADQQAVLKLCGRGQSHPAHFLSRRLSFRFGCIIRNVVCVAEIIGKAQRFSGNAFLAEAAELVLEPDAAPCEFELDKSLSDQEAVNRGQY
jgi:hypothetical protein